jgi:phosphoribosylformylglycinamidine synthase
LKIQNDILKREPTMAELILWSIQGSEHSSYKSSRKHLKQFVTTGPDVMLGPSEDAGIVAVATDNAGHRYGLVVSHESHNHPSQIVPYEGAATGIGGNVRDVSCMGAKVVANADPLRFGDITKEKTRWIHEGVVSGIAGYGNPIGVPTIAGDVQYDPSYNENCLVNVVSLGVLREDEIIHSKAPEGADGYDLILVGKPTDMSGFGGAAFASLSLKEEDKERNKGAVQEPNAFLKRHLLKANDALFRLLKARNLLQQVGFKDLGAGGIACAAVELADSGGYGAEVNVDLVPVSVKNLNPAVILCSETQERFMWVAPPDLTPDILKHYNETFALPTICRGAEAKAIGKIRHGGVFIVRANGADIIHAPAAAVTKGLAYDRPFEAPVKTHTEPALPEPSDYPAVFLNILSHENVASRAPVYERYDKSVQGATVIEPGEADAGVIQPFLDDRFPSEIRSVGVALSVDQNPRFCRIDPYWGAVNAVVEAARNVAAVGAFPIALTDCLNFGNPEKPEQMWEFAEGVRGVHFDVDPRTVHGESPLATFINQASINWTDLAWIRAAADPLPVLLKGIVRADDAKRALDEGAGGLWVSNHGGRQLDTSITTARALPEVAEAVAGRVPIVVDGGIRRGTDILKALALGADLVAIGRPYLWGLAAAGDEGVRRIITLLNEELSLAMALAGCPTLADIDPGLLA